MLVLRAVLLLMFCLFAGEGFTAELAHLAIMKCGPTSRVEKYQNYSTKAEADAHVARVTSRFPSAYTASHPGGNFAAWLCDPVTKTVVLSPPPVPPVQTDADKAAARIAADAPLRGLVKALAKKLNLTEQQLIDAIKAELP